MLFNIWYSILWLWYTIGQIAMCVSVSLLEHTKGELYQVSGGSKGVSVWDFGKPLEDLMEDALK